MTARRIAFLSPEYVTGRTNQGGLASYLQNIARALVGLGHEVEIFTLTPPQASGASDRQATVVVAAPTTATSTVMRHEGVRITTVPAADNRVTQWMGRAAGWHWRISDLCRGTLRQMRGAAALAAALEERHRAAPFAVVQSSEHGLAGLFVPPRPGRTHLVRCSSPGDLYITAHGARRSCDIRLMLALERRCIARADVAYAPSRFTAEHYRSKHGLPVQVVRPPLPALPRVTPAAGGHLPERYLLFFGKLGRLKGTDVLAQALVRAWADVPELTMVWAGAEAEAGLWESYRRQWGTQAARVIWLGAVERQYLLSVIAGAQAAVLPSRCDNLPNTLLESLSLGIPVIGSRTGGLDEVIAPGHNGRLVPVGDAAALAEELVHAWRGELAPWQGRIQPTAALLEMDPATAAGNLLKLAGYETSIPAPGPGLIPQRRAA